jgi:flagellar biogenesis protein FliO
MELLEQIAMVLVVFALLGGLLWFAKRRGLATGPIGRRRAGDTRLLEVLDRIPLTPQHSLHLVRVTGRIVLIATAPSACSVLDTQISKDSVTASSQDLARTIS